MPQTTMPDAIPLPPNFPIEWENPEDGNLLWLQVQTYYPNPVTPMGFDFIAQPTVDVANEYFANLDIPLYAAMGHFNGYVYNALLPPQSDQPPPPEPTQEDLNELITGISERWQTAWFPEIQEHLAWWDAFDLQAASMPILLEHLAETEQRMRRMEGIHIDLGIAMFLGIDLFEKMIEDLFPEDEDVNAHTLLVGSETEGTKSNQALWNLSRRALADPSVEQILRETAADDVLVQLATSPKGQAFQAEFNTYLDQYGYQGNKNYISQPTLREDPTTALQSLQGYLTQPDRDMNAEAQTLLAQREQALTEIRDKLSIYPQPIIAQFEFLLKAAQDSTWLREEHAHWLDMQMNYRLRQVLLEFGRRLHDAEVFDQIEDIFYLTTEEVRTTASTEPYLPRRELIRERKETEATYANILPPPMFGPIPTKPPFSHPIVNAMMQNAGDPSQSSVAPGELKGMAGSSGRVRGRARILQTEMEATRLNAGDILVTATTGPAWTPLFANIAGLVTASGGVLSHAAVVAREYQIPAVVGASAALLMIQDGQIIDVDGTEGIIYLIDEKI